MTSMLSFFGRQLFITPKPADLGSNNLEGQVGLCTGSNTGLGYAASMQLLELGLSKLILAVRSQQRGDEARDKLAALYPRAEIEVSIIDMASYDSIAAFVKRCAALPRLDFAILNAGVVKSKYEQNPTTGHEETIQINVLSTALLASLLAPVLASKASRAPGKITVVGSEVAEWASFKERCRSPILPQFDDAKRFDSTERYYVSKLLLDYYIIEAAKRLDSSKVILNVANPGLCNGSELHRDVTGAAGRAMSGFKRLLGRTCEVGARPLVKAAVVEGQASHGKYYSDNAVTHMAPLTRGTTGQKLGEQVYREIMSELRAYGAEAAIKNAAV
ncbi:hypothetical protein AMS68_001521 [Peltaster fructicola]|uniref:Ketoreductase (KR) domain-containing protein n=1 Tax=Peltaster fructicola TaxID=286661 RepID=A0A6H0XMQ2_9PEZI|nr:hypothetical protein AMS68_001521 [Peltaster fructicola]